MSTETRGTEMMENVVRELVGGEVEAEADEIERIVHRLLRVRDSLARLESLLDTGVEPMPTVTMEGE